MFPLLFDQARSAEGKGEPIWPNENPHISEMPYKSTRVKSKKSHISNKVQTTIFNIVEKAAYSRHKTERNIMQM